MTSRLAHAGKVCLRCQWNLLSGPRPGCVPQFRQSPLTTPPRSVRLYSFDSVWGRLQTATDAKEKENVDNREIDRGDREREPASPDRDEPLERVEEAISVETPTRAHAGQTEYARPRDIQEQQWRMPKERGHKGRVGSRRVVLQPESIGVDMLGQQAHTIVMRDDLHSKPRRQIKEDAAPEAVADSAAAEIQAYLEAAEGEPSPEEAQQNIEELRPQAGLLPRNEFWALHHELCEGFTNRQLTDYSTRQRKILKKKTTVKPVSVSATRPRRPWMAAPYAIRPTEKLEVTAAMNPKARRALLLMTEVWHLDIWERVEGLSTAEVTVKNPAVAIVLSAGDERNERLAAMRAEYLQPGESVTWVPETRLLSIVARRTIVETIITEVERITNNIAEETIALLPSDVAGDKERLSTVEAVLDHLCGLTNAAYVVEDASRRGEARIMWVEENPLDTDGGSVEKMGHTVWRLLYTAHAKPESTVVMPLAADDALDGRLDLDTRHEEKLPWLARHKSWARWVVPVHREGEDAASPSEAVASSVPALAGSSTTQAVVAEGSIWGPSETSISTTFGHVLFQAPEGQDSTAKVLETLSTDKPTAHILTTVVPPPSGLAPLDPLLSQESSTTTIVLRFAAGPDHTTTPLLTVNDGSVGLHPSAEARYIIELYIDVPEIVPEDGILTWDSSPRVSARAVLETTHSAIPLPDRPVDLRVTRVVSSALRDPESIPSLRRFVNTSRLDISRGSLRAQPTLAVPVAELAGLPPLASDKAKDTAVLEFLGLEVRRTASLLYQGHDLTYSSVEAGLHGGRYAELTLGMATGSGADEVEESTRRQRYLDLAVSLADSQLVRWGDGPQRAEPHGEELVQQVDQDVSGERAEEDELGSQQHGDSSEPPPRHRE